MRRQQESHSSPGMERATGDVSRRATGDISRRATVVLVWREPVRTGPAAVGSSGGDSALAWGQKCSGITLESQLLQYCA